MNIQSIIIQLVKMYKQPKGTRVDERRDKMV